MPSGIGSWRRRGNCAKFAGKTALIKNNAHTFRVAL